MSDEAREEFIRRYIELVKETGWAITNCGDCVRFGWAEYIKEKGYENDDPYEEKLAQVIKDLK